MRSDSITTAGLAEILAGDMPNLPPYGTARTAACLRDLCSPEAGEVWLHPAWAAIYDWITRRVPDCDAVRPAVHAVRLAPLVRDDPTVAGRVGRRILAVAHESVAHRPRVVEVSLDRELADRLVEPRPVPRSLTAEAADLFRRAGISVDAPTWEAISEGLDITVDWLDDYCRRSGLTGEALLAGARNPAGMPSTVRLRAYLPGLLGRRLVALMLGGDQWGRHARTASGQDAALLRWALAFRMARQRDEAVPVPPDAVVEAWAKAAAMIAQAVTASAAAGAHASPRAA